MVRRRYARGRLRLAAMIWGDVTARLVSDARYGCRAGVRAVAALAPTRVLSCSLLNKKSQNEENIERVPRGPQDLTGAKTVEKNGQHTVCPDGGFSLVQRGGESKSFRPTWHASIFQPPFDCSLLLASRSLYARIPRVVMKPRARRLLLGTALLGVAAVVVLSAQTDWRWRGSTDSEATSSVGTRARAQAERPSPTPQPHSVPVLAPGAATAIASGKGKGRSDYARDKPVVGL